jgi:hypothetical protein
MGHEINDISAVNPFFGTPGAENSTIYLYFIPV